MIIKNATFVTSAATSSQFLKFDKPVIAVCGKSNVGKSSFINMLANQKKLAKTSQEPGRTRLVNYFDFGQFVLADLPGYGFAKVSKEEKEKWAKTLDEFFADKEGITHVFCLADLRHDPTADDLQMVKFLNYNVLPFTVIGTKADKLPKTKVHQFVKNVANCYGLGINNVIATSSETHFGKEKVLEKLDEILSVYNNRSEYFMDEEEGEEQQDE